MSAVAVFRPSGQRPRLRAPVFLPGKFSVRLATPELSAHLSELDRVRVMGEVQTDAARIPALASGTVVLLDDGAAHALVEVTHPLHLVASLPVRLLRRIG